MALLSDDWVSTFTPETARLAEAAMRRGELEPNFQFAVPRQWAEAHPDHGPVIWRYFGPSILTGEPFPLSVPSATETVTTEIVEGHWYGNGSVTVQRGNLRIRLPGR